MQITTVKYGDDSKNITSYDNGCFIVLTPKMAECKNVIFKRTYCSGKPYFEIPYSLKFSEIKKN